MVDMIHLVNPENPVKVHTRNACTSRGSKKTSPSWRKFTVAQMKHCVIICSTFRRGAEERDVCHGR